MPTSSTSQTCWNRLWLSCSGQLLLLNLHQWGKKHFKAKQKNRNSSQGRLAKKARQSLKFFDTFHLASFGRMTPAWSNKITTDLDWQEHIGTSKDFVTQDPAHAARLDCNVLMSFPCGVIPYTCLQQTVCTYCFSHGSTNLCSNWEVFACLGLADECPGQVCFSSDSSCKWSRLKASAKWPWAQRRFLPPFLLSCGVNQRSLWLHNIMDWNTLILKTCADMRRHAQTCTDMRRHAQTCGHSKMEVPPHHPFKIIEIGFSWIFHWKPSIVFPKLRPGLREFIGEFTHFLRNSLHWRQGFGPGKLQKESKKGPGTLAHYCNTYIYIYISV